MNDLLTLQLLGNNLFRWLTALLVAVAVFIILRIARALIRGRVQAFVKKTPILTDDVLVHLLSATRSFFLASVALIIALRSLELPEPIHAFIWKLFILVVLIQLLILGNRLISLFINHYSNKEESSASAKTTLSAINFVARLVLYSLLVLVALDNFGIDITALVAGLGVTSIAVALAVQNILGDLFASLSIVMDKPFEIGDFIIVDDYMGTIDKIGLRSTRVTSLSGEQLVFSNHDLLSSRIRNFKRMNERRILFSFGLTYDTPAQKLARVSDILMDIIDAEELARFDRAHFKAFGDYALEFEVVYYMLDPDYTLYMTTQESINLALKEKLEAEGVAFAFPTRTLYVHEQGAVN